MGSDAIRPDPLAGLNDDQRAAVTHTGGPMAVLAGPGSGKTRVITRRVAWLIEQGAEPESVLAVTFTVKAADELRERLAGLGLPPGVAERVRATNFHRFGLSLVRRFADVLGLPGHPVFLDSAERRRLLRDLSREHGLLSWAVAGGRDASVDGQVAFQAKMAHEGLSPEACLRFADQSESEDDAGRARLERFRERALLYGRFSEACRSRGRLTLDDLILLPIELLRTHAQVAAIVRSETGHVVVDEFQDVNRAQIELLRLLAPPSGSPDLCVVGDDDQSIYEFRGADDRAFVRFERVWEGARFITLGTNYRSSSEIVATAAAVIERAGERKAKTLVADRAEDEAFGPVECIGVETDHDYGEAITAWILADRAAGDPRAFSEYAVIARTHTDLDRIAAALRLERIPTARARRSTPADDPGVRDLLAWMELLADPSAHWAARRLLTRPPIGVDAERVTAWERAYRAERSRWQEREPGEAGADDPGSFVEWLVRAIGDDDESGARAFLERYAEFRTIAAQRPAGEVVSALVREGGLAHADLPADRARRVAALVAAMNWASAVEPRLEEPRDIGALWRHYQELDDEEASFGLRADDKVDGGAAADEEGADEDRDAVALLTAHASKGLEYPVVFVPRVQPSHGYGAVSAPDEDDVPEDLFDRAGDTRDTRARLLDEQRRLFYVACTRAQDRLVLLAKRTKKPSKYTHFFQELTLAPAEIRRVVVREAEDVIRGAAEAGAPLSAAGEGAVAPSGEDPASVIAGELAAARREASSAFVRAASAGDASAIERAAASAAEAVRRAAIAASVTQESAPAWVGEFSAELGAYREGLVARVESAGPALRHRVPEPPLKLSYTSIQAYRDCPACCYVRYVLGLEAAAEAPMVTGRVVHQALARFAERWRDAEAEGAEPPDGDVLRALGRSAYLASIGADAEVDRHALDQIVALLDVYDRVFHDARDQVLEIERFIQAPYVHEGVRHDLEARFDRLDQTAAGFRLVDFKTGRASKRFTEPKADDLQLGIYALAVQELLGESVLDQGTAEYWMLQTGERGVAPFAEMRFDKVREAIDGVIEGVLAGRFEQGRGCKGDCVGLA
ncbi:MAG: ATP-dependent DNA helicase [Planctomycetota bacterium]